MADYQVLLVGGPCDKRIKKLTPDEFASGETTCSGAVYVYDGVTRPTGSLPHFTYRPGAPPPGVKAPRAHKGWNSLRDTFNTTMPKSLRASQHSTSAALRTLQKARKVKL